MTFENVSHDAQFKLTSAELLAISREISLNFSPTAASALPSDNCAFGILPHSLQTQAERQQTGHYLIADNGLSVSAQEMLTISNTITAKFAPQHSVSRPDLFILAVDPYHIYAYWALDDSQLLRSTRAAAEQHLRLRIYWRPDAVTKLSSVWFDVAIDSLSSSQQVRLPIDDSPYSAAIGFLDTDYYFYALAYSNVVSVPVDPGRINIAALLGKQAQSPLAVGEANPQPIENQVLEAMHTEKNTGQRCFPDHSWTIKLHLDAAVGNCCPDTHVVLELMDLLQKQGINMELIPEPDALGHTSAWWHNASGKGLK